MTAPLYLRDLQPGEQFILRRTGQRFTLIRRDNNRRGGWRYVVQRRGFAAPDTLHHSCRVLRPLQPPTTPTEPA